MRMNISLFVFVVLLWLPIAGFAAGVDNSLYAEVLKRHVRDGLVDYAALKSNRAPLDAYLEMMGTVDPENLSRNGQLAFYINLYNAATLRLIVDHYPVESIKDIGSFFSSPWKASIVTLNGELVSLDHIEHEIIRARFNESRIHFALNCSAISCPILHDEPYSAGKLERQLSGATTRFINDGSKNYLLGRVLYISKIFDWFSGDFPEDIARWVERYSRDRLRGQFEEAAQKGTPLRVEYLKYDWSLNDQAK